MTPAEMKERGEFRLRRVPSPPRWEAPMRRDNLALSQRLDALDAATREPLVRAIRELGEENRRLTEILRRYQHLLDESEPAREEPGSNSDLDAEGRVCARPS